jgi:menaquinol-cytochrome c reductase iron-sulfur subunit
MVNVLVYKLYVIHVRFGRTFTCVGRLERMSEKDKGVSRRQFLNYTLMGVGGFLVAAPVVPMLRFAIDPALKVGQTQDLVAVGDMSQFGTEPKRVDFKLGVVDGWAEYDVSLSAWVTVDQNGDVLALSPICKHLGCTVEWNSNEKFPNKYFCPCHDGLYTKDGVNVPGTPPNAPLDVYYHEVVDGTLFLGKASPRGEL